MQSLGQNLEIYPVGKLKEVRQILVTVESVFLYGSETWTLTNSTEKQIDVTYTRMLCTALNVSWRGHITNKDLYGHLQTFLARSGKEE